MSKLWKHEWKYHISFIIITTLALFIMCHFNLLRECRDLFGSSSNDELQSWLLLEHCNWIMTSLQYYFLEGVGIIAFVCLLAKKVFIYWTEQNRCGREFFQSLPINKMNRVQFHLIMDLLQLVLPVIIYGVYEYVQLNTFLETVAKLHIPWLLESMFGMMITSVCYTVMLLGVLYLMEAIFVDGSMKLICFVGVYLMAGTIFNCVFDQLYANKWVQNIIGFFTMESAGGAQYDLLTAVDMKFNEIWSWQYDSHFAWFHEHMDPPLQYMGEWFDYSSLGVAVPELEVWLDNLNRVYAFSDVGNYIWYALGYLAIGLLLFGFVVLLTGKKELSKDGFYFDFGRYLVSGMVALTMFCMLNDWSGNVLQIICNVAACIIVVLLLLHFLNPERKKLELLFRR